MVSATKTTSASSWWNCFVDHKGGGADVDDGVCAGDEVRVDLKGPKATQARWDCREPQAPQVKPVHRVLKARREKQALKGTTVRRAHKALQVMRDLRVCPVRKVRKVTKVSKDLQVWMAPRERKDPLELLGQW